MPDGVELATGYVSLIVEGSKVNPEVRRRLGEVQKDAGKAGKTSGTAFAGSFGKTLKAGAGLFAGVQIGRGAVEFLKSSIDKASDLNETVNKSNVIFGKNAKVVDKWASGAASAIGLSKRAALESAASFGDMFSQIGEGAKRATKMSTSVVQLAADLGSFNNLSTEDVLDRIAGGFRGEYDALQKVIPNISAARVQEETLRKTHKKAAKDLTAAEKAEATLAIIRKDGSRAAGDFARTSGGLANQQKILKARTDDLQAAIGKGLLPVETKIVSKTSEFVAGMQNGTGAGGEFVDVLHDAADIGKGVLAFFDSIPGPVKKYGVELLIVAVGLGKVNNLLVAGRGAATSWVASLNNADTTLDRTSKASYALGAGIRNLAGAAGMLAVVKSTHEADLATAGLERTLGGAAAGFSVGGPIGGGIGFLAGAISVLKTATAGAGKATEITLPTYKQYADTLDGVTAAATKATRALAFQRLEQSGLLEATRALGLSDHTAVQAVLGNANARAKLAKAMIGTTQITGAQKRALEQETGALGASRLAQLRKNIAIAGNREELRKAKKALRDFMAEPASKRVSITGVESATAQLKALRQGLREALGLTRDLNTAGHGGIGLLLSAPIAPKKRAGGGSAMAGQPYIVGDRGPRSTWELFIPNESGQIQSRVPAATSGGAGAMSLSGVRVVLNIGGRQIEGVMEQIADSRVDAAAAMAGETERAFG